MGNQNNCCVPDRSIQWSFKSNQQYQQCSWYSKIREHLHKNCNQTALKNEFRINQKIETIRSHLRVRGTQINMIFTTFLDNPNQMMFNSNIKNTGLFQSRINNNYKSSEIILSFIRATEIHFELNDEIHHFIQFFSQFLQQFYNINEPLLSQLNIFVTDEIFENLKFYEFIKNQYQKALRNQTIAYQKYIINRQSSIIKYEKSSSKLNTIVEKRSPKEKLQILQESIILLNCKNEDADQLNGILLNMIIEANIPTLVVEIKIVEHFAGDIDTQGQLGYILTMFMGMILLMIQNN